MRGHPAPLELRFWEKVDRSGGPDACWPWLAGLNCEGHGHLNRGPGLSRQAHRIAYELTAGPIPPGLDIDHMCHNEDPTCRAGKACLHRRCVNPAHLVPATRQQNLLRGKTLPAAQVLLTECPAGHDYDAKNTYTWHGQRHCKECRRARNRAWYARKQLSEAA